MQIFNLKGLCTLTLFFISAAFANSDRHIHVNGEHLDYSDIIVLDRIFQRQVPSGFYWLDFETGDWGYEGNARIQGNLSASYQSESSSVETPATTDRPTINSSQNGSVVMGKKCSYASVGGTTIKLCD